MKFNLKKYSHEIPENLYYGNPEDYEAEANDLAKKYFNVLRGTELEAVILDNESIVGALFVDQNNSDFFSFDVVVHPNYRRLGIGKELVGYAVDKFNELKEVYGEDYYIDVRVINPDMKKLLEEHFGFEVDKNINKTDVTMKYQDNSFAFLKSSYHYRVPNFYKFWVNVETNEVEEIDLHRWFVADEPERFGISESHPIIEKIRELQEENIGYYDSDKKSENNNKIYELEGEIEKDVLQKTSWVRVLVGYGENKGKNIFTTSTIENVIKCIDILSKEDIYTFELEYEVNGEYRSLDSRETEFFIKHKRLGKSNLKIKTSEFKDEIDQIIEKPFGYLLKILVRGYPNPIWVRAFQKNNQFYYENGELKFASDIISEAYEKVEIAKKWVLDNQKKIVKEKVPQKEQGDLFEDVDMGQNNPYRFLSNNKWYKVAKDHIPGGLSEGKKPGDYDRKQLESGIKIEMEHTTDKDIATEIAMDHLEEDSNYYIKLNEMEKTSSIFCFRKVALREDMSTEVGELIDEKKWNLLLNNEAIRRYELDSKDILAIINVIFSETNMDERWLVIDIFVDILRRQLVDKHTQEFKEIISFLYSILSPKELEKIINIGIIVPEDLKHLDEDSKNSNETF